MEVCIFRYSSLQVLLVSTILWRTNIGTRDLYFLSFSFTLRLFWFNSLTKSCTTPAFITDWIYILFSEWSSDKYERAQQASVNTSSSSTLSREAITGIAELIKLKFGWGFPRQRFEIVQIMFLRMDKVIGSWCLIGLFPFFLSHCLCGLTIVKSVPITSKLRSISLQVDPSPPIFPKAHTACPGFCQGAILNSFCGTLS